MASQRGSSNFPTKAAESTSMGARSPGGDSQKINCIYIFASHFLLLLPLISSDLIFIHFLSSPILHNPPSPQSHPWPASSFCCFSASSTTPAFHSHLPISWAILGALRTTLCNHTLCSSLTSEQYCWAVLAEVIVID